ncbi:hypothetical protein K457DRAFT_127167 [Linnemannia elongata AG-77]|uniref:Uncharacterized protein n=1 Tax=Linnemannia elongata AG-77 TaxID=1314771 RepID=A0A197JTP4_9FUNG|nr:hypothetical protein K457DRAFT_127167 [Linnemannia elongata AG-77]
MAGVEILISLSSWVGSALWQNPDQRVKLGKNDDRRIMTSLFLSVTLSNLITQGRSMNKGRCVVAVQSCIFLLDEKATVKEKGYSVIMSQGSDRLTLNIITYDFSLLVE